MATERNPGLPNSEVQTQIQYRLIERLSESERRYRALVEHLGHPVLQCDHTGRLDYLNAAWYELTGYDAETCLGRTLVEFADPADIPKLIEALAAARGAGECRAVTCEFRLRRRGGDVADVSLTLGKAADDRVVGSLRDRTHEKDAQQALERARDAAEEASRMKSSFLANMSHEIRTPLSAVLGYTELLATDGVNPEERQDCASRIHRNGQHLLALVNDILDFSRIESGRLEFSAEPFVLCELVDDLERDLKAVAQDKGLEMQTSWSVDYPPDHLLVTDRTRLRQILTNLLSNAIKFTADGSVSLAVETDLRRRILRFTVSDTGIGIAEDKIASLFEPFRQADETITRRYGGTGLGLAISSRLAAFLGGALFCESTPGSGSCFTLEIPLRTRQREAAYEKQTPAAAKPKLTATNQQPRVLIVEDTPDLRQLMGSFCQALGLHFEMAADGAEAVERLGGSTPFSAVLMDMQMPVLDGYSATQTLRDSDYDGLVIAMTAHAMRGDREKCIDVGCDDYLAKPVTLASLRAMFEKHCLVAV